jgi:hypothetical protein
MRASEDLFGGDHHDAIISLHEGRGAGAALFNPDKIRNTLRQLIRWASGRALRKHRTALLLCRVPESIPRR